MECMAGNCRLFEILPFWLIAIAVFKEVSGALVREVTLPSSWGNHPRTILSYTWLGFLESSSHHRGPYVPLPFVA